MEVEKERFIKLKKCHLDSKVSIDVYPTERFSLSLFVLKRYDFSTQL